LRPKIEGQGLRVRGRGLRAEGSQIHLAPQTAPEHPHPHQQPCDPKRYPDVRRRPKHIAAEVSHPCAEGLCSAGFQRKSGGVEFCVCLSVSCALEGLARQGGGCVQLGGHLVVCRRRQIPDAPLTVIHIDPYRSRAADQNGDGCARAPHEEEGEGKYDAHEGEGEDAAAPHLAMGGNVGREAREHHAHDARDDTPYETSCRPVLLHKLDVAADAVARLYRACEGCGLEGVGVGLGGFGGEVSCQSW